MATTKTLTVNAATAATAERIAYDAINNRRPAGWRIDSVKADPVVLDHMADSDVSIYQSGVRHTFTFRVHVTISRV